MGIKINKLENGSRKIIERLGNFSVLEYDRDMSVSPLNAVTEYYMSEMGVKRRQVLIELNGNSVVVQSGAMQWTAGNVISRTGIKGVGDLLGKFVKSAVTKESAVKPEYTGNGYIALEPTYKYIILQDVSEWGASGMTIEDGMFFACDSNVKQKIVARSSLSSAVAGNEGLFNLSLSGEGIVALESNVPMSELLEIELDNDELKIDGDMAVCWTSSLQFTVERSSKSLIGSAVNGEGLVNVFRGTGKVLMSPVTSTDSLLAATNSIKPSPKK